MAEPRGMPVKSKKSKPNPIPLEAEEILKAVRDKYSRAATHPGETFSFPLGRKYAESVGYPKERLRRLPASLVESFAGAHNPLPFAALKPGETGLDLGCGAGLDMYFAAGAVGPEGFVHGLDMSAEMTGKAGRSLAGLGINNAVLHCAAADKIPLPDASIDVVISNGIYNLSPDKKAIAGETFRVLKPGGRTVLSEIILKKPMGDKAVCDIEDWFK